MPRNAQNVPPEVRELVKVMFEAGEPLEAITLATGLDERWLRLLRRELGAFPAAPPPPRDGAPASTAPPPAPLVPRGVERFPPPPPRSPAKPKQSQTARLAGMLHRRLPLSERADLIVRLAKSANPTASKWALEHIEEMTTAVQAKGGGVAPIFALPPTSGVSLCAPLADATVADPPTSDPPTSDPAPDPALPVDTPPQAT